MRVIVAGMHRSGTTWLFNSGDPTDCSPLTDAALRDIEGAFGDWLANHGYPV